MARKFSRSVNETRRKSMLDYIRENYSLETMLKDLGVWDGGTTVIKCPFHPDSRPSFNIDIDNNFYKCFSCGSSGGYASFYHAYHTHVTEDGKYFNDHMEEILQSDEKMQAALGFSTIFIKIENNLSLQDAANFQYKPHEYIRVDTKSLQRIRRKLQRSPEKLIDFFADVEKGITLNDLWNKYYLEVKIDDVILDPESKDNLALAFSALLSEDDDEDDAQALTGLFDEE